MIKVDGDEYSDDLVWVDEFDTPGVAGGSFQTCGAGGKTVFQRYQTNISRNITLVAQKVDGGVLGHFTYQQCQKLKALEGGPPVELFFEGEVYTVWVMKCTFEALTPRPNRKATDLFIGSVKMREV